MKKKKTAFQELKERGYKNPKKTLAILKKAGLKETQIRRPNIENEK